MFLCLTSCVMLTCCIVLQHVAKNRSPMYLLQKAAGSPELWQTSDAPHTRLLTRIQTYQLRCWTGAEVQCTSIQCNLEESRVAGEIKPQTFHSLKIKCVCRANICFIHTYLEFLCSTNLASDSCESFSILVRDRNHQTPHYQKFSVMMWHHSKITISLVWQCIKHFFPPCFGTLTSWLSWLTLPNSDNLAPFRRL